MPNLRIQRDVNVANKNNYKPMQITELSNVYYKPLSFGRSKAEHKSWGGAIDAKTKEVSFKLFTFPDVERVTVTVQKKGSSSSDDIQETEYELKNKGNGVFETAKKLTSEEAAHGDKYFFTIYKADGNIEKVKDPYSYRQESILGASTLYDHSLFQWNDSKWYKGNTHRISRLASAENGLTPLNKARIYEFNTATITKEGTFKSAQEALQRIKDMGFNAIEIMPVENTYSFNWGYDGVDKLAASEYLGGPDQLKELIDKAHSLGLNVIMDMVPNHLGPDGAALSKTGPYIKGPNAFGDAFNYEGQDSRYVRDYMVNSAMNWLENYHCDGLRLDMTKFMDSDYTMKQIAAEINYHIPDAFLIAEDGRNNDKRVTTKLNANETGEKSSDSNAHIDAIEEISSNKSSLDNLGYDSEWDFKYYHSLKDLLYGNIDLDAFENVCINSGGRVKYVSSHDEQGNFEGTALIAKHMVPLLNLNENVILSKGDLKRAVKRSKLKSDSLESSRQNIVFQKAQFVAEKLAIMLQTGHLEKYNNINENAETRAKMDQLFSQEVLVPLGIKTSSGITYQEVLSAFTTSFAKNKLGLAATYSIPGPKMVFQGDENADLTPFRFFREFESMKHEPYLYTEKGYEPGQKALAASKIGQIKYSQKAKEQMAKFQALTTDLNRINDENSAISTGVYVTEDTVKHQYSQVIALHSKDENSNNEIYTVNNFGCSQYPDDGIQQYYIKFPKGKWVEILNTDDNQYGGNNNTNKDMIISSNGEDNSPINLASYSTAIFKKID